MGNAPHSSCPAPHGAGCTLSAASPGIAFHSPPATLHALESESHEPRKCLNCGTPLPGEFCPKCGQRDYDFDRSFREIAHELAESFWSWDSKLLRGVIDLLFRPGFLTTEFLAGRRASQVPPLRFYLFVSILFFLTMSFEPAGELFDVDDSGREAPTVSFGINPEATGRIKAIANAANQREPDPTGEKIANFLRDRYERRHEAARMIGENLPKLVFACLPVFALITRVVFRRARLGYLSHLVMALHLHSFYFLFSLVSAGWVLLLGLVSGWLSGLGSFAAFLYTLAYVFMAVRRVFGGSRAGTFWRSVLAAWLYLMTLGIGFLVLIALVFLMA